MNSPTRTPADENRAHHYPSAQGLHQAALTVDPWESFFTACLDAHDELLRRRAQAKAATLPQDEDIIRANGLQTK
jgi:hypothetical protein